MDGYPNVTESLMQASSSSRGSFKPAAGRPMGESWKGSGEKEGRMDESGEDWSAGGNRKKRERRRDEDGN